ncbi:peptidoglycan editing factor PgeF [Peptacetobacter sp. AB845]|uniref:peptidoglycan editing factor PgeF n=1 Tax=Peptacetobacter sp. AB845 TaxID=3388429 RepID=UPI0039C93673
MENFTANMNSCITNTNGCTTNTNDYITDMNNCTTDMNDFITKEIKFKDGGFAKVVITERKYDAKNKEDIKVVFDECGLNYENMTDCKQIHSDIVRIIKKDDIGVTEEADAMITDIPQIPLMIYTADCVPIVLVDTNKKIIADIHAGWRGTYAEIVVKTIKSMLNNFGTNPEDIVCIIGPAIGSCCYEVSKDLVDKFNTIVTNKDFKFYIIKEDRFHIDLTKINSYLLEKCGVKKENIHNLNICTSCQNDKFYSYRKDNKTDKRIGTIVQIKL